MVVFSITLSNIIKSAGSTITTSKNEMTAPLPTSIPSWLKTKFVEILPSAAPAIDRIIAEVNKERIQ